MKKCREGREEFPLLLQMIADVPLVDCYCTHLVPEAPWSVYWAGLYNSNICAILEKQSGEATHWAATSPAAVDPAYHGRPEKAIMRDLAEGNFRGFQKRKTQPQTLLLEVSSSPATLQNYQLCLKAFAFI